MYCWLLASFMCSTLMLAGSNAGKSVWSSGVVWTRDNEQNFSLSACVFQNDSLLQYSCHDNLVHYEDYNTFEVSEMLCGKYQYGHSQREVCKRVALLFARSGEHGLCVSSRDLTANHSEQLKQTYVKLPVNGINHHYFPNCWHSELPSHIETHVFACSAGIDHVRRMVFSISGYVVSADSVWTTELVVNIVHNCHIKGSRDDNRDAGKIPHATEIFVFSGGVIAIAAITIGVLLVIIKKCLRRSIREGQVLPHNGAIRLEFMPEHTKSFLQITNSTLGYGLPINEPAARNNAVSDNDIASVGSISTSFNHPETDSAGSTNSIAAVSRCLSEHQQDNSSLGSSYTLRPLPKLEKNYTHVPSNSVA